MFGVNIPHQLFRFKDRIRIQSDGIRFTDVHRSFLPPGDPRVSGCRGKKSGWGFVRVCHGGISPFQLASSSNGSGSPMMLEASDPVSLGDDTANGRKFCQCVQRPMCRSTCSMCQLLKRQKNFVASLEVSSLRCESTSSRKIDVLLWHWQCSVEWWLRSSVTKITGKTFLRPQCNFNFFEGCLCEGSNVSNLFVSI